MGILFLYLSHFPRPIDTQFPNPRPIPSHNLISKSPPSQSPIFTYATELNRRFIFSVSASSDGAELFRNLSKSHSSDTIISQPVLQQHKHANLQTDTIISQPVLQQHKHANLQTGTIISQPVLQQHNHANLQTDTIISQHVHVDSPACSEWRFHIPLPIFQFVASTVLFACFCARAFALGHSLCVPSAAYVTSETSSEGSSSANGEVEEEEFRAAFEQWKSKTFALTVPLRIVALRNSVPPSWLKDFAQVQGRRLKMSTELRGSIESIYSELNLAFDRGFLGMKSAMSADLISLGDSWLSTAVQRGLIDPIPHVKEQDWFKSLGNKWKVHLCRNAKGELDPSGNIWGAPYRWGTMVIAYKKSKFKKHNFAPIEDWDDLWRPELTGKISMVDSPREVVGAVLKRMGASYNTKDVDLQVIGGRESALHNLISLQKQVRCFDSVHYMKAFGGGDVWVAVGWSSDVIPAAKRMAGVTVVIPKSGSSIWADLWATPAATKFKTDRIGGRVRGPSPLIHQWIEFCLQIARVLPFRREVFSGSPPFALEERLPIQRLEPAEGKPKLDTNLVDGIPPPEILEKCEFLEPLSDKVLEDYRWLISRMKTPHGGLFRPAK